PVWEANHVWLIFVITVCWTAYPSAFASIASTLAVPLFVAAVGIIFRGLAYALRAGASTARERRRIDLLFAVSSVLTPFALGTILGGIASRRVPVGNARGSEWSSWLNLTSITIGVLAVATSAYLAAVFLAADSRRHDLTGLEQRFRRRALGAGVVAGALAVAALPVLADDAQPLFHRLVAGAGLPALIVSLVAGCATIALVWVRLYEPARYTAATAVAAIVAGAALDAGRGHRRRARRGRDPLPVARVALPPDARRPSCARRRGRGAAVAVASSHAARRALGARRRRRLRHRGRAAHRRRCAARARVRRRRAARCGRLRVRPARRGGGGLGGFERGLDVVRAGRRRVPLAQPRPADRCGDESEHRSDHERGVVAARQRRGARAVAGARRGSAREHGETERAAHHERGVRDPRGEPGVLRLDIAHRGHQHRVEREAAADPDQHHRR